MGTTIIIGMGTLSVACAVIEKVLIKLGKSDDAQMASIAGSSAIAATAIGCVVKVFAEIKKL
jgi:hypothetical protein